MRRLARSAAPPPSDRPRMPIDDPAPASRTDPRELLDAYLDHYRAEVLRKLDGLAEEELRSSRVASGWTPLELLVHLTWVERRWFEWGFAARPVPDPWGDRGPDGRWAVPESTGTAELKDAFRAACARSREIVAGVPLDRRAAVGGRFAAAADAPSLALILFHVLQEYARHAGHLDIARELADGVTGE
ncbi:DinB family protein [Streptomyces synnematoformans]|uniref:DinB family protein n=2 Tax=Streptomyces synnematoformans TaxID=415721 RepID=A0ABN2XEQ5_9ACTN